jgi:hypothetical protein
VRSTTQSGHQDDPIWHYVNPRCPRGLAGACVWGLRAIMLARHPP